MDALAFQKEFFALAEKKLNPNQNLSVVVQDLFNISLNSAYRKIRGESALSLDQLLLLSAHFRISIDRIIQSKKEGYILFNFRRELGTTESILKYFTKTTNQFNSFKNKKDARLKYVARDLPLFLHLKYPHLASFQIGFWFKRHKHMEVSDLTPYFNPETLGKQLIYSACALYKAYESFPKEEVWTENTLDNTLAKIGYCKSLNILNQQDAELIYTDIINLLDERLKSISTDTSVTSVYKAAYFSLSNGASISGGAEEVTFVGYSGINFIQTSNETFNKDFNEVFELHKQSAILLSGSSEAERNKFFMHLKNKVLLEMDK